MILRNFMISVFICNKTIFVGIVPDIRKKKLKENKVIIFSIHRIGNMLREYIRGIFVYVCYCNSLMSKWNKHFQR